MKRFYFGLIACLMAATSSAQSGKIDPHAEVAAVLFAASATQAALAKSLDANLKVTQERITLLAAELKAGDDRHRAEMVAAQESFVSALAAKDREYAAQIAVFRKTVSDIASTAAGAQALERFNAGDEVGALAILDKLRAGNGQMRAEKLRLEDAAEARRIARLALEARSRGKVPIDTVIVRFEEVVKLDPGAAADWVELERLYVETGRLADARRAVDSLAAVARDERERESSLVERADVLMHQGDLVGARGAADEALKISRNLLAKNPSDLDTEFIYAGALLMFGETASRQGDLASGEAAYGELVTLMRRRSSAPTGTDDDRHALASDLLHLADTSIQRGEMRKARATLEENIALLRQLLAKSPDNIRYARQIAVSLMWLTDVLVSLGQFAEAHKANEEIIATATRLAAAEPNNGTLKSDLGLGYIKMGVLSRIVGELEASLRNFEQARSIFHGLASGSESAIEVRENEGSALSGLADTSFVLKDVAASKRFSTEAVALYRKLGATDATEVVSHLFLAESLYTLAQALTAEKDFKAARKAIDEGLAIDRSLAKRAADNSDVLFDISTGQLTAGDLLNAEGRPTQALVQLRQSLEARKRLAAAQPGSSSMARSVAETMRSLVDTPGSNLSWAEFAKYLNSLQSQGVYWPADRVWLEEASQHGAM